MSKLLGKKNISGGEHSPDGTLEPQNRTFSIFLFSNFYAANYNNIKRVFKVETLLLYKTKIDLNLLF